MTQTVRSAVLSLSMLAAAVASPFNAFAADKPATCLEGYRQAAYRYMHTADRAEETMKTAKIVFGSGVVVGGATAWAATPVTGLALGGAISGYGGWSYRSACTSLNRLENATMILSVYENLQNTGGATDIPEGQDLLLETFANQGGASNCSLWTHEEKPEQERHDALAKVSDEEKNAVLKALVDQMQSGQLCDRSNAPKDLGDVVAELKNYERAKTRGTY